MDRISMMAAMDKFISEVSTKGQVTPAKPDQPTVEKADDAILPLAGPAFAKTRPEDVFGALLYTGKPKSIAAMNAGIREEARRRHYQD